MSALIIIQFPQGNFNYTYDAGNRLNDQLSSYAYDVKSQRLLEDYQFTYSYDNNGNLVTKARKGLNGTVTNFIYSTENQLIEVQFYEAYVLQKTVHYSYDALGRRTKRTVTDTTTTDRIWTYDGNEILSEYDGSLNVLATYTQSSLRTDDTLAVRITSAGASAGIAQASGNYHYLKDALGSVTDVVDASGNLVQHYVYSSFGKIIAIKDNTTADVTANAPIKTAYTFTNREWDAEAGLYYYRARYYAPEVGRFLQEDSFSGQVSNPLTTINKYIYGLNSPHIFTDPTGKFIFPVLLGAFLGLTDPFGIVSKTINFLQKNKYKILGAAMVIGGLAIAAGSGGVLAAAGFGLAGAGLAVASSGKNAKGGDVLKSALKGFAIGFIGGGLGIATGNWAVGVGFYLGGSKSAYAGGSEKEIIEAGIIGGAVGGATEGIGGETASPASDSGMMQNIYVPLH